MRALLPGLGPCQLASCTAPEPHATQSCSTTPLIDSTSPTTHPHIRFSLRLGVLLFADCRFFGAPLSAGSYSFVCRCTWALVPLCQNKCSTPFVDEPGPVSLLFPPLFSHLSLRRFEPFYLISQASCILLPAAAAKLPVLALFSAALHPNYLAWCAPRVAPFKARTAPY